MTPAQALKLARRELGRRATLRRDSHHELSLCICTQPSPSDVYVMARGRTWAQAVDALRRRLHGYKALTLLPEEARALLATGVLPSWKAEYLEVWLERQTGADAS